MKVAQLIEALQNFNPEMEVHFGYDYGDYWHSWVAPKVNEIRETNIVWSEYHRLPKLVDNEVKDTKTVVVLST